eukprot:UN02784
MMKEQKKSVSFGTDQSRKRVSFRPNTEPEIKTPLVTFSFEGISEATIRSKEHYLRKAMANILSISVEKVNIQST